MNDQKIGTFVFESPKFALGQVAITPAALAAVAADEIVAAISRHSAGDWGDLERDDKAANEAALIHGGRLLSAYHTSAGTRFWLLTEADRSRTTLLLPEDY